MKVQDLFEKQGAHAPGYNAQDKNILGTVKDWMERLGATPEDIEAAVAEAKNLSSFKALSEFEYSTAAEQKNGTFSFKKPNRDESRDEKYIVYANGQIRSSTKGFTSTHRPTRLAAPKPRLVAGSAVKSLVKIYDGAFKELAKKIAVRSSMNEVKAAMYQVKWKGYPGKPKPETHDISYFSDDMGFDEDDIQEIKVMSTSLAVPAIQLRSPARNENY
jgi:hypothetical protein